MRLGRDWHAAVERQGRSFTPPAPHLQETRADRGTLTKMRAYRRNVVSLFEAQDFRRTILRGRIGLRTVMFVNTPQLIRAALQDQHETFQAKTPQLRQALRPLIGESVFLSHGALWRERRRAVAPIVHANRTAGFAPIMTETIAEWRDAWSRLPEGAPLDVLSEMAELTAEIISRTVFGRRLGRAHTGEVVRGFSDYQARADQLDLLSLLGAPDWLPRPLGLGARRGLARVHRVVDGIVDAHARGEGDPEALIGNLFEARDARGRPMTTRAIRNEAMVLFMAGHETTANTLAWAWFLLAKSPRVRRRLRRELDAVLGGRPPVYEDVRRLPYARAIIEETLRLYPPVPILGREALADGAVGKYQVRKGDLVLVSPYLTHRRPRLWSKPDQFVPERFVAEEAKRPAKYGYIPFAIGPRICPGQTFGLVEAVLSLATLAQAFKLTLEPGHAVAPICRLTLRPGERLPMRLHHR